MTVDRQTTGTGAGSRDDPIMAAALELLGYDGFDGMTLERVVARAQVPAASVYARWRSRADLLVELLRRHAAQPSELPDTGTLRGDLLAVTRRCVDGLRRAESLLTALVWFHTVLAEGPASPERLVDLLLATRLSGQVR
jgi:AcrR family transcriptional regulator